jgi:tRNA (guanine37-N1)-methyltransferase
VFDQPTARSLSDDGEGEHIVFICGRFEGYDARIVDYCRTQADEGNLHEVRELSIGNYVLFGGEVAVLVMIEAIARLIPGVVGNPESLVEESHELTLDGKQLLEYPNYTRPQEFQGLEVPPVLLSGNHAEIDAWRLQQSTRRTANQVDNIAANMI